MHTENSLRAIKNRVQVAFINSKYGKLTDDTRIFFNPLHDDPDEAKVTLFFPTGEQKTFYSYLDAESYFKDAN